MTDGRTFEDAFNLLCGKLIGEGIHRKVFECRIASQYVVKVEQELDWRCFANVNEMRFWTDHQYYRPVARWLAPCFQLSPDGRILLQHRATPVADKSELPKRLPSFLTDIKPENFGWIDKQLVCVDYALVNEAPSTRLRKAEWD